MAANIAKLLWGASLAFILTGRHPYMAIGFLTCGLGLAFWVWDYDRPYDWYKEEGIEDQNDH